MQETVKLFPRKLPTSCYEIIRLPTVNPKAPPNKGLNDQQPEIKRRKIMGPVVNQADKFRPNLKTNYPGFTKTLTKSHVSGYFQLDAEVILQGSFTLFGHFYRLGKCSGKTYKANYLSERGALGGGWREFCLAEKLSEGDVIVFRLVSPIKFKVGRIRNKGLSEMTEARITPFFSARVEQRDVVTYEKNKETRQASSFGVVFGDKDRVAIRSEYKNSQKVTPSITSQADKAKCPSFTKKMVKSHVSGNFWMGLPSPFGRMHLPSIDTYFLLEYENNGKKYKVKYIAQTTAFSGGWKGFSIASKFAEGDVLLFRLVNTKHFKVQKIRSGLSNVNGEGHVILSASASKISDVATREQSKETHQDSSFETGSGDENHLMSSSEDKNMQKVETIKRNTLQVSSGDAEPEHVHFPPIIDDQNCFTSFDDFILLLDDLLKKDNNLSYLIKRSYHRLCCSQKSLLHAGLLKDITPGMAAGCITEIVDIANAMKCCDLTSFDTNFPIWGRKLKSLELIGMNVKFLSARLLSLQRVASNSCASRQKYNGMCSEHAQLENMINELRRRSEKHADDIEKLKIVVNEHELKFQEQVSSPW